MDKPRHFVLSFYALLFFVFVSSPFLIGQFSLVFADDKPAPIPVTLQAKTRTVVADLLMIDENFYVVRGDQGEIRIEVTPDTKLSESFTFGDRIKAILLPNDEALFITRAQSGEPVGITINSPSPEKKSVVPPVGVPAPPVAASPLETAAFPKAAPSAQTSGSPNRIIIADLLMVDGNFYIVRSERGEIQIEITPDTQLAEKFKFGDRIKAVVTTADTALSVVRASADEPNSIRVESAPAGVIPSNSQPSPLNSSKPPEQGKAAITPLQLTTPQGKVIIAEILMVDGEFYVVRGERGEIRIEITPQTKLSEKFAFGDRIKAVVLPNDKALSVERAPR